MDIDKIIRVDHAGEYGAKRIYQGQIDVLKKRGASLEAIKAVEEMAASEAPHLAKFEDLINKHNVRPTALFPLWHVAGYALGAVTAAMGEKAAMACTIAIEETIGEHYNSQLQQLEKTADHKDLQETIKQFRDEELEHHDTGVEFGGRETPGFPLLRHVIRKGSKTAIWLSEKI